MASFQIQAILYTLGIGLVSMHLSTLLLKTSQVVALILNILPHVVSPVDVLFCLVSAPTLMLSIHMMVLYLVDQVQFTAEFLYIVIELVLTVAALINLLIVGKLVGAIYGLFYIDLIIAFVLDIYYINTERGVPT